MRIVTDSMWDRLTKPDVPDTLRLVIGGSLPIQPGWQNGEDIHSMADAIRQSIVVLTPDGATLYVNRAALDYTGVTRRSEQQRFFGAGIPSR